MPSPPITIVAPPPPPPPPAVMAPTSLASKPPQVAPTGPIDAFMVELLIYNGSPFKDHWGYWVRSHTSPDIGVMIHATGDVRNGFVFEIKRSHDLQKTPNRPTMRVPLQWVDGKYFDEKAMLNNGERKIENVPVCPFETSAYKVKVPGKSLNTTSSAQEITQKNCQTWIVESADQLLKDHIFSREVAIYLHAIEQ
ncbi:hypothetical protein N7499_002988 [Penicillium canescens]|uniref:Uncharacterized protein n=1 Tax=Penicillium canescens TaxID=5083 RepID=A0AAD6IBP6_PENCN|nr:uncharacterized protein N7446_011865 [Penicillium canescens]KAJ6019880.1 hypothetical protein N7522_000588 [Penicillium canescens]KAJ6039194.1 hypothetical protein N7460_007226 [Penicillium canescens]KAJ6047031.1 hypothetical protein N7446_011865 [Penicillium canescens]KAJ6060877.1 hypothetical protein N7444_002731 [Penicillium canescens]KAJ6093657.1 hypothetical protein N7499_002988 [Penicillium canescens]